MTIPVAQTITPTFRITAGAVQILRVTLRPLILAKQV